MVTLGQKTFPSMLLLLKEVSGFEVLAFGERARGVGVHILVVSSSFRARDGWFYRKRSGEGQLLQ